MTKNELAKPVILICITDDVINDVITLVSNTGTSAYTTTAAAAVATAAVAAIVAADVIAVAAVGSTAASASAPEQTNRYYNDK